MTRIAIEELEAWYFGNWPAVRRAFPRVSEDIPRKARFRNSDAIQGGTWEAFEKIMKKHHYFSNGLEKVNAASEIGEHFDAQQCQSHSFNVFHDAIMEAVR